MSGPSCVKWWTEDWSMAILSFFFLCICLAAVGLSCSIELGFRDWTWAPSLGAQSLSCQATREIPQYAHLKGRCYWHWSEGEGQRACSPREADGALGFPSLLTPWQPEWSLKNCRSAHAITLLITPQLECVQTFTVATKGPAASGLWWWHWLPPASGGLPTVRPLGMLSGGWGLRPQLLLCLLISVSSLKIHVPRGLSQWPSGLTALLPWKRSAGAAIHLRFSV